MNPAAMILWTMIPFCVTPATNLRDAPQMQVVWPAGQTLFVVRGGFVVLRDDSTVTYCRCSRQAP